jgi:hypothetical protein
MAPNRWLRGTPGHLRFTNIADVWNTFEPIFMLERDTTLAVGEAVGTVIFTLEQPERFA